MTYVANKKIVLAKPKEFIVNLDNTESIYDKDKLGRKNYVENLIKLIKTINEPFVISINGKWGSGKTFFFGLLLEGFKNERYHCLYFNAWKNDYKTDPLIVFVSEIEKELRKIKCDNNNNELVSCLDLLKEKTVKLIKATAPCVINLATQGFIGKENIAEFLEEFTKKKLAEYDEAKDLVNDFRNDIEKCINYIESNNEKLPIVFIIDELDRCRPDFALQLLERMKHLFSIKGLVFVLAMDKEQLISMVRSIYGVDMDGEGYLKRFIDLNFQLPKSESIRYCSYLQEEMKLQGFTGGNSCILDVFSFFAEVFKLQLRDIEKCFVELNIILRMAGENEDILQLLAFLVAVRAWNEDIFKSYLSGDMDDVEFIKKIESLIPQDLWQREDGDVAKHLLLKLYLFSKNEEILKKKLIELEKNLATRKEYDYLTSRKQNISKKNINAIWQRVNSLVNFANLMS